MIGQTRLTSNELTRLGTLPRWFGDTCWCVILFNRALGDRIASERRLDSRQTSDCDCERVRFNCLTTTTKPTFIFRYFLCWCCFPGLARVRQASTKFQKGFDQFRTLFVQYLCLVCFKPMALLCYRDTTYLVKLWYLKEKTRLIKSIFYFKRHKCRRST